MLHKYQCNKSFRHQSGLFVEEIILFSVKVEQWGGTRRLKLSHETGRTRTNEKRKEKEGIAT